MWKITGAVGRHAVTATRPGQLSRHCRRPDAKMTSRLSSTFSREAAVRGGRLCAGCCPASAAVRCYAKSKDKKSNKGSNKCALCSGVLFVFTKSQIANYYVVLKHIISIPDNAYV